MPITSVPEVCLAVNQDDCFIFRLVVSLNGNPAHPAILLQANTTTKARDVKDFLTRVSTFPFLKYFIVGVNFMVSEARAVLIKWVSFYGTLSYQ